MKCTSRYERKNPDTIGGYQIVVTNIYSSFDEREIDTLEKTLKASIGSGIVGKINLETEHDT